MKEKELNEYEEKRQQDLADAIKKANNVKTHSSDPMDLTMRELLSLNFTYRQLICRMFDKMGVTDMTLDVTGQEMFKSPLVKTITWGPLTSDPDAKIVVCLEEPPINI
ncbi:MAG: hypothetical protein ACP5N7_00840 [Candidatus Pacearchaeota archaeon]